MSKQTIINNFFIEHLKVKEIADKLNVSPAYITKIIKQDARYESEKQFRKKLTKEKRKVYQNNFAKVKRENKKIEDNYSMVESQHIQAVRELSKGRHLNNEIFRKWNYSAYTYNPLKNRYEFDERLGRAADVPKYVKGK